MASKVLGRPIAVYSPGPQPQHIITCARALGEGGGAPPLLRARAAQATDPLRPCNSARAQVRRRTGGAADARAVVGQPL